MLKMKIAIIGGSNTVMRPGYASQLIGSGQRLGLEIEVAANFAVGNTTSAAGLMQLKASQCLELCDVLLIEYALNDSSAFGETRLQIERWARMYESIIRYAFAVNPKIKILSAIFVQKNGAHRAALPSLHAGIYYLTEWYQIDKVDINVELMRRFGRNIYDVAGIYADAAHYSRPIITQLISEIIAYKLLNLTERFDAIPPAVDPRHFAEAVLVDVVAHAPSAEKKYNNSRFSLNAIDLASADLRFKLDGQIVAAQFVCVPNISRMYIRSSSTWYEVPTMRVGIRDGRYSFLSAILLLDQIPKSEDLTYTISVKRPPVSPQVIKQHGAPAYSGALESTLPLSKLLVTGNLGQVEFMSEFIA